MGIESVDFKLKMNFYSFCVSLLQGKAANRHVLGRIVLKGDLLQMLVLFTCQ